MKLRIIITFIFLILIAVLGIEHCKSPEQPSPAEVFEKNDYAGSQTCTSCHSKEHNEWLISHHARAMLPANDSSVLGNFDNAKLVADGVITRFFKKDGKFYINTQGDDGKNHDYEIKYTFGFTPLQQYLVEFPGGRMQATRASWDTQKKKWFHQYAGQKIPAGDWLHWTGNSQNWNTMCAACHSTNVHKGYDEAKDTYQTSFNEVNITCESCHGPGKLHIEYVKGGEYAAGKKILGSRLLLTKSSTQKELINACGYCHARRAEITDAVHPGKEFMNDFIPELPTNTFFYADGQMNDEDYNYTSFLQSKMFRRGVQCMHCHNPHSGSLKLDGNIVCSQCHATATHNTPAHTMHSENSVGSSCINCHMPSKIYMGIDLRHDHSFRIPRPDLTAKYGVPNTCNSCHKDKSAEWAAAVIQKNFGSPRYHFSEDLIPGSEGGPNSEVHLIKVLGDTATPAIVRAAAIDYIGKEATQNAATILLAGLLDTSADVRFRSLERLSGSDPSIWMAPAAPLLHDPVRAVRIGAADLFITVPENQIPQSDLSSFYSAKAELERYLGNQTDFAQGNVKAGDYYKKLHQLGEAEKFYRRALRKDSRLTIAKINLASTLNEEGKNLEALQELKEAQRLEPNSDHIYYSLGLLYAEMNQPQNAAAAFQHAIELRTSNIRVYYNYALLLQQQNKKADAEQVFLKGLSLEPSNGDLLYALTILYVQEKQIQKAIATGKELRKYHPDDPNYRPLLQQLKL